MHCQSHSLGTPGAQRPFPTAAPRPGTGPPALRAPRRAFHAGVRLAAVGAAGPAGQPPTPLPLEERERLDRLAEVLSAQMLPRGDEEEGETLPPPAGPLPPAAGAGPAAAPPPPPLAPRYRSRRASRRQAGAGLPVTPSDPDDPTLPRVAIVGRPNVGKSALFNRLAGADLAIVYDTPGVTRDRLYCPASWGGRAFLLADTGGLMGDAELLLPPDERAAAARHLSAPGLPAAIERQAAAAVAEAAALILCVDGQQGLAAADEEIVAWLRRAHPRTPVLLAVNKCESPGSGDLQAAEFWGLGLEPIPVSAISGTGTGELLDALTAVLPREPTVGAGGTPEQGTWVGDAPPQPIAVAIVGRPNVGKSSLLNRLVGKDRSIVSDMAGTTRDAVDTTFAAADGSVYTLIDTAGVRRRTAVASSLDGAETLSVNRALRAVRRADVAVLVLDATEGIAQQDFRLAEYVAAEGRACVVVVNKWDTVAGKGPTTIAEYEANVRAELRPVEWANLVFCSATTGLRVSRILEAVRAASAQHRRRVSTSTLNMVVREAVAWRAPPSLRANAQARVYYATQAATAPPTFVLFTNAPGDKFPQDYKRFMERQLREHMGFPGTPLRVYWRGKEARG